MALTVTLTGSVDASDVPAAADAGGTATTAATAVAAKAPTIVTLVTGDRVLLDADGAVTGLERVPGRESVPVQVLTDEAAGQSYVIPADAQPLLAAGTLDRRLFNVTELARAPYRSAAQVPLIVTYADGTDGPTVRGEVFAGGDGPEVAATLESTGAEALRVTADDAAATWRALTRTTEEQPLAAVPGVERIALDALAEATLDQSVPQIGAPAAWDAGFDGTGTTIAVLDTGVHDEHDDLSGDKVVAEENFTETADTGDPYGHGTHVASIAAGTGAHAGGAMSGVAPGASLLNGKVLDDAGQGFESGIIEGMEWAVDQGADIVNMSLGSMATEEIDPLEAAVDSLSASSDALFVVASGNAGPAPGSLNSPGTADAALTVGAVDDADQVAGFSSVGPRMRDGAVKPDVTAPGVGIAAASSPGSVVEEGGTPAGDGYVAIDGTSMAAPHVAGAAALLAQARPELTAEQLKSVLVGSTQPTEGHTPMQQGTGRVDVAAALAQRVVTEQSSLNFGRTEWPHEDDEPIARDLEYTNLTDEPVTLHLTVEGTDPSGAPAPEGMFTTNLHHVVVPPGQTLSAVDVVADTSVEGPNGVYTVAVTATEMLADGSDGEMTIRTVGSVHREVESHDLSVTATGRDGTPAEDWYGMAVDLETFTFHLLDGGAELTERLPAGSYLLQANFPLYDSPGELITGLDWLVQPGLALTEDVALTLDARDAEPVEVTVPDAGAEPVDHNLNLTIREDGGSFGFGVGWYAGPMTRGLATAQLGGLHEGWAGESSLSAAWRNGDRWYHTAAGRDGELFTGLTKEVSEADLARISTGLGGSLPDRTASLAVVGTVNTMVNHHYGPVGQTREVFVDAAADRWSFDFLQADPVGAVDAYYRTAPTDYQAGQEYAEPFNVGVFGPLLSPDAGSGVFREGDTLSAMTYPFADSAGHLGGSEYVGGHTTLYRDGEEFASAEDVMDFVTFELPPEEAEYEIVSTVNREGIASDVTTEVTLSYRFTSARPEGGERVTLPASAVRFTPDLALDSTSPAGETVTVPFTVQGSAEGDNLASLTVSTSVDGGETWQEAPVTDGTVRVTNPAAGGSVSLRAEIVDTAGNATTQTIVDAYRTS
ncbi:S8 family serine peptidase [Streptomyces sp. 4N509B]|uniref:S8 family serine peptidase n=1 Tax=Streptomyces sp. 4N509B TaxID=3457413 RepID=UPI003FD68415